MHPDGIDTKDGLIRVLAKYGFDGGHIANVLNDRKGPFRNSDYWRIDANGRYALHETEAAVGREPVRRRGCSCEARESSSLPHQQHHSREAG
ncbi:MAG TPA: hypothetical protein VHU79_09125, partial [Sphingomicrobium sp.]|nr:hypothetical protein [Sphingomicrobium sp.]